MTEERILRAVADDGTAIAARIHGQGPPLVLVHGGLGDGEVGWRHLLPHLIDTFTCISMSTRGRGLSEDGPEHTLDALTSDVVATAEAVGEPVALMGWSLGGTIALGAAARSRLVSAVGVYEPGVFDVASGANPAASDQKAAAVAEAVADGRLTDGARALIRDVATAEELAALAATDAYDLWAPNLSVTLRGVRAVTEDLAAGGFSPTAPSSLADITVPVLYLHGTATPTTWYVDGAHHVARHAGNVRIVAVPGTGHFAPMLAPGPLADALLAFFAAWPHPA
jgi:pimeloyl-ACP methyl ester carboxylesterase